MGIIRFAKSLRLLNSIDEYDNRADDIKNKISGNRVYMDFVSIIYLIQESVRMELNYLLYSFMLINAKKLNKKEYDDPKLIKMINKYYNDELIGGTNFIDLMEEIKKINESYINTFKKFSRDNINNFIYRDVVAFINDMLNNKITDTKYVLIAFDGIPSFAKIEEQRHRRYMRAALSEFEKSIFKIDSSDALRNEYDRDHFIIDIRSAIDYIYFKSANGTLKIDIESKSPQSVIEIINEAYGEGEKILMDRLLHDSAQPQNINSSYIFYSPDGDSVILCLYIYILRKINTFTVIKTYKLSPTDDHNNQSQYVDIKKLYHNIPLALSKYSTIRVDTLDASQKDAIARDYIFMMSFFGNDFIHQIPTMEISCTTMDLMYVYANFIADINNAYLLKEENNKIKINVPSFIHFIKVLSEYEQCMMMDTYLLETEYRSRIFKTFGSVCPFRYLMDYIEKVKPIREHYYKHKSVPVMNDLEKISTMSGKTYADIFTKNELNGNILKKPRFIYDVKIKDNKGNEIYKLVSKDAESKDESFDLQTIRTVIPHNQMPITKKDIDLYLLEWKAGKWRKLLKAYPYDFGYDYNNKKIISVRDEMKRYETKFLHNPNKHQLKQMVTSYLEGLSWIVDYYMNKTNFESSSVISTWSYVYDRSLFITHIADVLSDLTINQVEKIMDNVYDRSSVPTKDYLTSDQHKFYIYPQINLNNKNMEKVFPNIKNYVDKVMTNQDHPFDCRLCPYFSKCIFRSKHLTFKQLMDLIGK